MINSNEVLNIKNAGEDYSKHFEKILDNNPKYIIMSSFSFFLPSNLWNKLKNLQCPKLLIIPHIYYYSKGSNIINQDYTIKLLMSEGITVIFNSVNHAKYILTDKDCFVGSNNLTTGGIISNIENSYFMFNKCGKYTEWERQIFKFLGSEISGFASLERLKELQSNLNNVSVHQLDSWQVDRNSLYDVLQNIETLKINLLCVNDCYQHLGKAYNGLIKKSHLTVKNIGILIRDLTDIYIKLQLEYEMKKQHAKIFINQKEFEKINFRLNKIKISLNQLNFYREDLFEVHENSWRSEQSIYKYLGENTKNKNLKNLKNFINTVMR